MLKYIMAVEGKLLVIVLGLGASIALVFQIFTDCNNLMHLVL